MLTEMSYSKIEGGAWSLCNKRYTTLEFIDLLPGPWTNLLIAHKFELENVENPESIAYVIRKESLWGDVFRQFFFSVY